MRAGHLIRGLIAATTTDAKGQDAATTRFAEFFLVSAFADPSTGQMVASCKIVSSELARLEQHAVKEAGAGE